MNLSLEPNKNSEENPNQHPMVIIIPKSDTEVDRKVKMVEVQLNATLKKTTANDHANTPMPGSINGSCIKDKTAKKLNTDKK